MEIGAVIKHDLAKAPKTGAWRYMHPEVDKNKCIGCGTCVDFCPEASINLETRNAKREAKESSTLRATRYANIDYEYCKGCGVCAQVCPVKAILMQKK
jgi:pyruvate ferredoxin oxidoreductase delta subunit